jgi:hypothetical protein
MATATRSSSGVSRAAAAALALACAAVSSQAAIEVFTSGTPFYKRVITNTSVNVISTAAPASTTFADVPGTLTTIFIPPQTSVLVSVNFDAEARCNGGNKATASVAADPNWCELMVMIGGVEGSPQASTTSLGDTYSFASTDNGEATFASWRGHAMSRHRCVRNASNAPLPVAVSVQWKIVNFSPAGAPSTEFWLDDSAMVIQMSRDCVVQAVPAAASIGVAGASATQGQR